MFGLCLAFSTATACISCYETLFTRMFGFSGRTLCGITAVRVKGKKPRMRPFYISSANARTRSSSEQNRAPPRNSRSLCLSVSLSCSPTLTLSRSLSPSRSLSLSLSVVLAPILGLALGGFVSDARASLEHQQQSRKLQTFAGKTSLAQVFQAGQSRWVESPVDSAGGTGEIHRER